MKPHRVRSPGLNKTTKSGNFVLLGQDACVLEHCGRFQSTWDPKTWLYPHGTDFISKPQLAS